MYLYTHIFIHKRMYIFTYIHIHLHRTRKLTDHGSIVNSCSIARDNHQIFASGSDDCTVIIWDERSKKQLQSIYHDYQVTAVCMAADGNSVFSGGLDNIVRRWDLRMNTEDAVEDLTLEGHTDIITGLAISPDGNHLLSNGMDSALHSWDVKPFRAGGSDASRWERTYEGGTHGAEKLLLKCSWSADQERVACGSADRMVYICMYINVCEVYKCICVCVYIYMCINIYVHQYIYIGSYLGCCIWTNYVLSAGA
jgi:Prp8 binding protein